MADVTAYQRTFDFHDGSHHQPDAGPVDLQALARVSTLNEGCGPVVCWKVSQSTRYVDPTFSQFRDPFNEMFDNVFWYHWISSVTDPVEQAEHYLETMGRWRPTERFMLDGEEWNRAEEEANPGTTEDRYATCLETVEEETEEPSSVYTGLYVAFGTIWRSQRIRMSKYGPRPMHLAAYISRAELLKRMTQLKVIDLPMHFWQFSSNGDYTPGQHMTLPGITGRADLNHVCDWSMVRRSIILPTEPPTAPAILTGDDVMSYRSNSEPRPATDSDPGHAWFELMPGGLLRIVHDINEVKAALCHDQPETLTAVRIPNAVIDGLLANGEWAEITAELQEVVHVPCPECPEMPPIPEMPTTFRLSGTLTAE